MTYDNFTFAALRGTCHIYYHISYMTLYLHNLYDRICFIQILFSLLISLHLSIPHKKRLKNSQQYDTIPCSKKNEKIFALKRDLK